MKTKVIFGGLLVWLAMIGTGLAAPSEETYVDARLISESETIQPGTPLWVGLELTMDEHWHTYWRNAGDAGLATKLNWQLPEGFEAGDIQWPYPQRIELGGLMNFGYEGTVLLLVRITPPEHLEPGSSVTLSAKASWLVCKEICLPGGAEVSATVQVQDAPPEPDATWADAFAKAREKLPITDSGWTFEADFSETHLLIAGQAPDWFEDTPGRVSFFPYEAGIIQNAADQELRWDGEQDKWRVASKAALSFAAFPGLSLRPRPGNAALTCFKPIAPPAVPENNALELTAPLLHYTYTPKVRGAA